MSLFIEEQGSGKPVVLLHAFPLDHSMWESTVSALTGAGFRTFAVDLPGFGRSNTKMQSISDAAQEVIHALDSLNVNKFAFCGLSMGGYVGFEVIRQTPARILSAVFCDTTPNDEDDQQRAVRFAAIDEIDTKGTDGFMERLASLTLSPKTLENKQELVADLINRFKSAPRSAVTAALKAMADRSSSVEILNSLNFPVLLLFGSDDLMLPAGRLMESHIPDSKLAIIQDAGHFSNFESPSRFNSELLCFLETLQFE